MKLRGYQIDVINDVRESMKSGHKSVCVVLGCGAGKSVIQADIAKSATAKGNKVQYLVHRGELCDQIRKTFTAYGVDMSRCEIDTVQSYRRHIMPADLLLIDEAHTNMKAYQKIFETLPDAFKIGFSATPVRLSEGGLGKLFTKLVVGVSTKWLIENGYLSDYKYYSVPMADFNGIHVRAGDFVAEEVNALLENRAVYAGAVQQYLKFAKGKKTMVYCSSVRASQETCAAFRDIGITAAHLDGSISQNQREQIVQDFRNGDIQVLCNAELFSEGYDDKLIDCVILLRPTMSLSKYIQQAMRCMRPYEGKTAIIIDCVGNVYRHGLPDDDREWTLLPKKKQETVVKIRECTNCFAVYSPNLTSCPYCGFSAQKEIQTHNKKVVKIDLVEVERQNKIKNMKLKDAELKTWEEVVEFQQLHKYRFAWALHYAMNHGIRTPSKYNYMKRFLKG